MAQIIEEAREELKRADHLIYVSLKYTRTVEVIKSTVERLISSLDFTIDKLLEYAVEKKLLQEKPTNTGLKANTVKRLFPEQFTELANLYLLLRKISRAEYKKSSEYRRHVTMTAITDEGVYAVDIDKISEYFHKCKQLVEQAEQLIYGEGENIYTEK